MHADQRRCVWTSLVALVVEDYFFKGRELETEELAGPVDDEKSIRVL